MRGEDVDRACGLAGSNGGDIGVFEQFIHICDKGQVVLPPTPVYIHGGLPDKHPVMANHKRAKDPVDAVENGDETWGAVKDIPWRDRGREHLLSRDRVVFEAFDFTVIHVHSCCLHIIDTLLGEPALDMIQISIDHPGGPLAGEVMPTFERIMQVKPLIVTGPVTGEELRQLRSLEPAGRLCIRVGLISEG